MFASKIEIENQIYSKFCYTSCYNENIVVKKKHAVGKSCY
jgi:hypothetical protein